MALPNMPKNVRSKIYPRLLDIWPEICSNCQKTTKELGIQPFNPSTGKGGLELHHVRYDIRLDDVRFIRFMCHGCNHKSDFSRSELEKYNNDLSASMRANIDKHQIFLDWISDQMQLNHFCMELDEIIDSGAYVSGANTVTVKRWLDPLCSKEGPFSKPVAIGGVLCIYLKGANIERFPTMEAYQDKFNEQASKFKPEEI